MAFATVQSWDETPGSNTEIDGVNIDEGCNPSGINNAIRELMAQVAAWTGDDTIASATTTDLSTVNGQLVTVSGTTTITGFGTVKAGWLKFLHFSGALTLTHNATSLILPGAANITTAAGDTAVFASLGSGNWRCIVPPGYISLSTANTWTAIQTLKATDNVTTTYPLVIRNSAGTQTTSFGAYGMAMTSGTRAYTILAHDNGTTTYPIKFSNSAGTQTAEFGAYGLDASNDYTITVGGELILSGGPLHVPDGSVSAPTVAFSSDTNTGFYSVSADTIGIASGGSVVGYYNSTGLTAATTTATATFGSVAAVKNLSSGQIDVTRDGGTAIRASRFTDDGIVISIHNDATLVGSISFSGSTTSYNTSSDERLKPEDTRVPLEEEIDVDAVWDALEVLAYSMIDGGSLEPVGGRYYGMLAQKLYRIYPQAVTPGKGEPGQPGFEPWSIDYSKLVPLMVARQKQFERRTNERFAALGL